MFGKCSKLHREGLIVFVSISFLLCKIEMIHQDLTPAPVGALLSLAYVSLLRFLLGRVLRSFLQEVP